MFEKMKSELEGAMQAHNVPFASFGVTDAHATRLHAHIGSAGSSALDDTHIFRIASMTKPIVTLAALQLVARGDLRLDQPMKEIVPELGEVQVVGRNGDELSYAPLARDITLHHLLTHTSGFAYDFHSELIAELVAQEKLAGVAFDNDALDRPTDYLFQYNYIGRSETTGIYSQQFIPAEGGFKSQFDNPYSDDLLITLNSSIGLWKWIEAFGDLGYINQREQDARVLFDTGLRLNLVPDFLEIYFPLYNTKGLQLQGPDYQQKIRYVITFDPRTLTQLFSRKWF